MSFFHSMLANGPNPIVAQVNAQNYSAVTSHVFSWATVPVNGDHLFVWTSAISSAVSVSAPGGWSQLAEVNPTSTPVLKLWYKVASSEPASYDFTTASGVSLGIAGIVIRRANGTTPYESVVTSTTGFSGASNLTSANINVNAGSFMFVGMNHQSGNVSVAWTNSFTELAHTDSISIGYRKYQIAASAQNTNGSTGGSNRKRTVGFQVNDL